MHYSYSCNEKTLKWMDWSIKQLKQTLVHTLMKYQIYHLPSHFEIISNSKRLTLSSKAIEMTVNSYCNVLNDTV